MSDLYTDSMYRVAFVPVILDIAAPKLTEVAAGVDLEGRLRPDGLATPSNTGRIDNSKLNSTFGTEDVGRRSFSGLEVVYQRGMSDDEEAQAVEDALVYRAKGFLVIRRDKDADLPYAVGDKVEVYPVTCGQPNPSNPAPDGIQEVTVGFAMRAEPKAYGDFAVLVA